MSDYINSRILRDAPHVQFHAQIKNVSEYFITTEGYDEVPDPYCGTTRDFEIAVQLSEDACTGILEKLS